MEELVKEAEATKEKLESESKKRKQLEESHVALMQGRSSLFYEKFLPRSFNFFI